MRTAFGKWLGVLVVAAATGCGDDPVAPQLNTANLGTCGNLAVPGTVRIAAHVFATGAQIYRWDGNAWGLVSPSAVLTSDAANRNTVGVHYQGPTWSALDGSLVTASAAANCTPDPNAITWLLLNATATSAPGIFNGVTHIHRVNTVGGRAPATAGSAVGTDQRSVPDGVLLLQAVAGGRRGEGSKPRSRDARGDRGFVLQASAATRQGTTAPYGAICSRITFRSPVTEISILPGSR